MSLLRLQFGVPVEIIQPALVEIVWREEATVMMQVADARREWLLGWPHLHLRRHAVALAQVAGRAGGDDVFPGGEATLGSRDQMIEGEVLARCAVLATESIA